MPRKKPKHSSIKKLKEVTNKTNQLCLEDNESELNYDGQLSTQATEYSRLSRALLLKPSTCNSGTRYTPGSSAVCESIKTVNTYHVDESIRKELNEHDIFDLKEIFSIFDLQNCGKITFIDLLRALRFLRFSLAESELKEILESSHHAIDIEMDNFVDFGMFLYCVIECQSRSIDWTRQIEDVFHSIDGKNKGVISLEDLKSLNKAKEMGLTEKEMQEMILFADSNKDSVIDLQEFMRVMLQTNLFQ